MTATNRKHSTCFRLNWGLGLVLLAAVAAGCERETSILLTIDGNIRPGVDADAITVSITADGEQILPQQRFDLTTLPQTVSIFAGDNIKQYTHVSVMAHRETAEVLEVGRAFAFYSDRQAEAEICLYRYCFGADDVACVQGLCTTDGRDAGPDGDADADADGDVADDGDVDDDAGTDADVSAHPFAPIVHYTFDGVTDTFLVDDVSEVAPLVPLAPEARDPIGLVPGDPGVAFSGGRLTASDSDSPLLGNALLAAGSFTLEAWVVADNDTSVGPARIVTYSSGTDQRGFTIGQQAASFAARVRTTATDGNGVTGPDVEDMTVMVPAFPAAAPRQLVLLFNSSTAAVRLFVDGAFADERLHRTADGALATLHWNTAEERLGLGDELGGERPWQGLIVMVAIYDRALTPAEINDCFLSGPTGAR